MSKIHNTSNYAQYILQHEHEYGNTNYKIELIKSRKNEPNIAIYKMYITCHVQTS